MHFMTTPTCPYCNAVIPPTPGLVVGQRVACPRCGEAFAVSHVPADQVGLSIAQVPDAAEIPKPVRANRLVGGTVFGVMLLMAGVGLAYALATVQWRRKNDIAIPRRPHKLAWLLGDKPSAEELAVSPAQLVGLRYLPATTGFVVGVHVEELLAGTLGKDLQSKSWKVGPTELSLGSLQEWTGLALGDIGHIVVGVDVRDDGVRDVIPPPVHVVVHALPSDGANRIRVALKATSGREEKTPEGGERTTYAVARGTLGTLGARLWVADDRTVVIGVFGGLGRVPGKPEADITHLPREMRETIETRLAAGVPIWAVGHSTNWKNTYLPNLLKQAKDLPLAGRLEQAETFGLWLVPSRPVKVGGAFRFADAAAAQKVVKEDLEPRARANPETFRYTQMGPWVDVLQTLELGRER
jgi:hypothetical protein